MKYISSIILVLFLMLPVLAGENNLKSFKGRVIYYTESSVEVKWGPDEHLFMVSGDTALSGSLEICQVVLVQYRESGDTLEAVKIEVLRESDCFSK